MGRDRAPSAQALQEGTAPDLLALDPRGAIFYHCKTGAQWREMPKNFPPWQTVYPVFRRWTKDGTWAFINARLRARVRHAAGKNCQPSAGVLDRQSVKSSPRGGRVGYDAAKKIKGRQRHLLVDTLGMVLATVLCWLRWFKKR